MMFIKTSAFAFVLAIGTSSTPSALFATAAESDPRQNTIIKQIIKNLDNNGSTSNGSTSNGSKLSAAGLDEENLRWKEIDGTMMLAVDIVTTSSYPDADTTMRSELEALGGVVVTACYEYICGGYMDLSVLYDMEDLPSVASINPSIMNTSRAMIGNDARVLRPSTNNGKNNCSQATKEVVGSKIALQIPRILQEYPELKGGGLKIGIISDSFNAIGDYDSDIECGFLPDDVEILKDDPSGTDEGRGMAQVIYASAKDIKIAFYGPDNMADFAVGIMKLKEAGCDVIVDDLSTADEPLFQTGMIAKAANSVVENDSIPYFTAMFNNDGGAWVGGPYKSGPCPAWVPQNEVKSCHVFENGKRSQTISGGDGFGDFQWDSPYKSAGPIGSFTDINIYIAGSSDDFYCEACSGREDNIGKDPIEFWGLPKGIDYQLAIALIDGPEPSIMKWGSFNQGRESYKKVDPKLNASPFCPHGNTPLVSAVGAAFDTQAFPSLVKESFSSSGGVGSQPIYFDNNGIRYKKPRNYEKPNIIGPDVSQTSFFAEKLDPLAGTTAGPEDGFRFFGTSCGAPNVAVLALLLRQVDKTLTPKEIYNILERTAIDMDEPGFDYETGYGFVNGYLAILEATKMKQKSEKSTSKKSKKGKKSKNEKISNSDKFAYCDYTDTN